MKTLLCQFDCSHFAFAHKLNERATFTLLLIHGTLKNAEVMLCCCQPVISEQSAKLQAPTGMPFFPIDYRYLRLNRQTLDESTNLFP